MKMNYKSGRETLFPWMETVIQNFAKSFTSDYNLNILAFLHGKIDKEIKFITCNDGRSYTVSRTHALYIELFNFYGHLRLKINNHLEMPNSTLSCVKLLSQIIKTCLILTQGLEQSKWVERALTAIKFFTGKTDLIFDVLLLVNGLKKIYHKPYAVILKCVLLDDQFEYCTTDPLVYMKIILLFRRLRALYGNKYHFTTLVTKIKPPTNLRSWLGSLDVNGTSKLLKEMKYKILAQQLIRKNLPESLLQKIRDMALSPYYLEANYDEFEVKEKDPLDMFIIDTSTAFESQFNRKKLKSLSKNPLLNKTATEDTSAKESTLKSDLNVSYLNHYSNLVIDSVDTESVCESEASDTSHEYTSDSCRFVLQNSNKLSMLHMKKQKSKVTHIQKSELKAKSVIEENDSDSDLFFKSDVPLKKSKKEISCDNLPFSMVASKRSVKKNIHSAEGLVKKGTVTKSGKKLKSCIDSKLKHANKFTCDDGNATTMDFVSSNKKKLFNKQSNMSASNDLSLSSTEIAKKKGGGTKQSKKGLLKKQKSSKCLDSTIKVVTPPKKKKIKKEGYSSDVTDKFKSEYSRKLSLEKKSVSQTSSPIKIIKNNAANVNELLTNKRQKSDSDSSCKMVYSAKKKISKIICESSNDVENKCKKEYFRELSLEEKKPESETQPNENFNLEESFVKDSQTINENNKTTSRISEKEIPASVKLLETSENNKSKSQISDVDSNQFHSDYMAVKEINVSSEQNSTCENIFDSDNLRETDTKVENSCILSSKKGASVSKFLNLQSISSDIKDSNYLKNESTTNSTQSEMEIHAFGNIQNNESISPPEAAMSDESEIKAHTEDNSLVSENLKNVQSDISTLEINLLENNDLIGENSVCKEYSNDGIEECTIGLSKTKMQSIITNSQENAPDISKCNKDKICSKNIKSLSLYKFEEGFIDTSSHSMSKNSNSTDEVTTQLHLSHTNTEIDLNVPPPQIPITNTEICSPSAQTINLSTTLQSSVKSAEMCSLSNQTIDLITNTQPQSSLTHTEVFSLSIELSAPQLQASSTSSKISPALIEVDLNKPENSLKSQNICNSVLEDRNTKEKGVPSETKKLQTGIETVSENENKLTECEDLKSDSEITTESTYNVDKCNIDMSKDTVLVEPQVIETPLAEAENLFHSKQTVSINNLDSQVSSYHHQMDNQNTEDDKSPSTSSNRILLGTSSIGAESEADSDSKSEDECTPNDMEEIKKMHAKVDQFLKEEYKEKKDFKQGFPLSNKDIKRIIIMLDKDKNIFSKNKTYKVFLKTGAICGSGIGRHEPMFGTTHKNSSGSMQFFQSTFERCYHDWKEETELDEIKKKIKFYWAIAWYEGKYYYIDSTDLGNGAIYSLSTSGNVCIVAKTFLAYLDMVYKKYKYEKGRDSLNSQDSGTRNIDKNICNSEFEIKVAFDTQIVQFENDSEFRSERGDFEGNKENKDNVIATNNTDSISRGNNLSTSVSVASIHSSNEIDVFSDTASKTCTEVKDVCNINQSSLDTSINTLVESQTIVMLPTDSMGTALFKQDVCRSNSNLQVLESNANKSKNKIAFKNEFNNQTSDVQMLICDDNHNSKLTKESNSEVIREIVTEVISTVHEVSINQDEQNLNSCATNEIDSDKKDVCCSDPSITLVIADEKTHNFSESNIDSSVNSEQQLTESQHIEIIADVKIVSSEGTLYLNNPISHSLESDTDIPKNNVCINEPENQKIAKQISVCKNNSDIEKSKSDSNKSEEHKCEILDTCHENPVSPGESLNSNLYDSADVKTNEIELCVTGSVTENEGNCNIKRNPRIVILSTEQDVCINTPNLHPLESHINEPENLETKKMDAIQEPLISKSKDLSKNSHIATVTSFAEVELHTNDSTAHLVKEDIVQLTESQKHSKKFLPLKTNVCTNNPTLYSPKSITNEHNNSSEIGVVCSTKLGSYKVNKKMLISDENNFDSIKLKISNCEKSLKNGTETPDTILENSEKGFNISTIHSSEINCLSNSADIDSSSNVTDKELKFASETESNISHYAADNCKPSFESGNSEGGFTCDNSVSVVKDDVQFISKSEETNESAKKSNSKFLKTYKQYFSKSPLKQFPIIPTSEFIPYFCEDKSYVSFSDISLRDKDRSIEVDSGLKSPITHFSSAASTEIFSMYRNDVLQNKDSELVSRSDVLSNDPELSDDTKSRSLSSSHSDEDFDFKNVSDEENIENEVEISSDRLCEPCAINNPTVILKRIEDFSKNQNKETAVDNKNDTSSPAEDNNNLNSIDSTDLCLTAAKQIKDIENEEAVKEMPRQSLRLINKALIKSKIDVEENSEFDTSKPLDMPLKEMLEQDKTVQCSPDIDDPVNSGSKTLSSTDKNVCDLPQTPVKTKRTSHKSMLKKSSILKNNSKENFENCNSIIPKSYSLRHRKSSRQKDDSSNLGVDLNKLQLESPSSTRSTRFTRQSKFVKLLTLDIDSESSSDSTISKKRETRSSVAKTEKETLQNTSSYNLRNKKSIIDLLLQK